MRSAKIYNKDLFAGRLIEDENGFSFAYNATYMLNGGHPISLTMPVQTEPYSNQQMFPFFDGLIPEGWLLDIAQNSWKINPRDRMGLLLACCKDSIGAVSVVEEKTE